VWYGGGAQKWQMGRALMFLGGSFHRLEEQEEENDNGLAIAAIPFGYGGTS